MDLPEEIIRDALKICYGGIKKHITLGTRCFVSMIVKNYSGNSIVTEALILTNPEDAPAGKIFIETLMAEYDPLVSVPLIVEMDGVYDIGTVKLENL